MDIWHGAQWVLATYFAMMTAINFFGVTLQKTSYPTRAGWLFGKLATRSALVAVLYWGGFWS
ncbi:MULTISPECIES: hypothetical protein [unclassified Mesorhizobium]|uniref:hypothetical protein n=1 Tax=unclassified Mesorhizobium TaxID=325217 RepID=UPI00112CD775|nr:MULTISPECIES: hypothetical protein [unclassified Mesorhizobium]TPJ86979.1 hypothetical protein FJ489_31005 [Mesorhizobium sp. B2-5-12]TPK19202.1 hypothetical protein FJ562_31410 [Mesorhizobium sp. B2-5-6]